MTTSFVEARPAATAILLRDTPEGIEVLMVTRPPRGFFGGLTVFPGGAVDPGDASDLAARVFSGAHDDRVSRVAALRELAEETGILLTDDGPAEAPDLRGADLLEALARAGTVIDCSVLTLVSRWVTPEYAPKRFDTRFYLARADHAPTVRLDPTELVGHAWVTPTDALTRSELGEWDMFLPTVAHLRWLSLRGEVTEAIEAASGADGRSLILPRQMEDGSIVPIHLPGDR